jgi:TPR repeat protein
MKWPKKAAFTDNANGQLSMGLLYFNGYGIYSDYKQAMDWFLKAANN